MPQAPKHYVNQGFLRGCRPFSTICCKQNTSSISTLGSPNLFHWVTQSFPLGHPRFSTGSPKGSRAKKPNAADRELPLRQLLNQISKQKPNKQGISERTYQKNL